VVVDAKFATAPFLHTADAVDISVIARLKENLPEISAAVEARFGSQPPRERFQHGEDWVEIWDAEDFDPRETLDWTRVRVMRYRQHKKDGTVIQADWLTNFSSSIFEGSGGTLPCESPSQSQSESVSSPLSETAAHCA